MKEYEILTPQEIFQKSEPHIMAGSCLLKDSKLAEIVQNALLHFEGKRYFLGSWCVMPNHVHVIVTPFQGFPLPKILHSWKSFTANGINKLLERTGTLWERESFHHMIRSNEDLLKFTMYVEKNPVEAKFCDSPEQWPFSSCGAGFQPASELILVDPRKLPFAPPTSRGELAHIHKEGVTYFVTFRLLDAVKISST